MTLQCPACGAAREIADDALSPDGLVRCEFCRTIFNPRPDAGFADHGATEAAPAETASIRDRWFVEVAAGVYGPVDLVTLSAWIRAGRLDWEDLVSEDGGVWLPALEQRRLVESFQETGDAGETGVAGDSVDTPPVKIRPEETTPQQVQRGVRGVAAGLLALSLLTLNLPGVVIAGGLFAMRAWAHRMALALLAVISLVALAGMIWASLETAWLPATAGAVVIGFAVTGAATLLRRPVRASFRRGGALGAAVGLVVATLASMALFVGAWRAYDRFEASRLVTGAGYGYSLTRPSDLWTALPAPRPVAGHPEADLELVSEDGRARLLVLVDEWQSDASACFRDAVRRVRTLGINPTVYQEQKVSADGLIGEQGIASVERRGGRTNFLLTCYVEAGQRYQVIGIADSEDFEAVRSDLARLSTSLRLEQPEDPMQLDIQTRPARALVPAGSDPASVAGVVERAEKAVVMITVHLEGGRQAFGSGALLGPDGLLVTNAHVIAGAEKVMASIPGHGNRRATIVARDAAKDLAILRIKGRGLPFLPLAADPVRAGDDVIAIGSPMGLSHTVTKGIISSTRRMRNGVNYLQADVSINPGNSGGPLLNLAGEVVGINTFIVRESDSVALTGLNFALPAAYVREIAEANGLALPAPPSRTTAIPAPSG